MANKGRRAVHDDDGNLVIQGDTIDAVEALNPRASADYRTFKEQFVQWLAHSGKNPQRRKGYAQQTIRQTAGKCDFIYEWKWDREERYTREFTPEDANRFIMEMDWQEDYTDDSLLDFVKVLKRMFKYENTALGKDYEWDCPIELSQSTASTRDHLRKGEFHDLYEAALDYNTIKSYHACTPEERDRLKATLAQRFEKPKSEVRPADLERANGWKIPSLISVTLDVGFRPIEVSRANLRWFEPVLNGEHELKIPKEESTKNVENWNPVVSDRTVRAVQMWFDERDSYDRYADSDAAWLTKYGNPYKSSSLNGLFDRLLPQAGIDPNGRELSWYSIRHGVVTIWANEHGIHHAKEQLRHKSVDTTLRYVRSTSDKRQDMMRQLW